MGHVIMKLTHQRKRRYIIYSTVVDAPITFGMTLKQLKSWWRIEYGKAGLQSLPYQMQRVHKFGTSYIYPEKDARYHLRNNRAGKNGKCLSYEELIKWYVVLKTNPK